MNNSDNKKIETTARTVISKEHVNHSDFIPQEGDNFCTKCGKKLTTVSSDFEKIANAWAAGFYYSQKDNS